MQKEKPPNVLVFDSGVGGLSILRELQRQHSYCNYNYVCDNAAFPYGEKSAAELINRVDSVLYHMQKTVAIDIVVIACNTASTVALPSIRRRFTQPVVGVVPAIKPAAKISETKVIGLLATPGTITGQYTRDLIDKFAKDCQIICVGSVRLVNLTESRLRNIEICNHEVQQILQPFSENEQLDTIVLGCTHFPLLLTELKTALPNVNYWVEPSEAIARRLGYWLDQQNLTQTEHQQYAPPRHNSYFTANKADLEELQPLLTEFRLGNPHIIDV